MAVHHTFGDSCMLKEESNTFTRRASSVAIDAPKITAQFFYCSGLPIDDPLAAIPVPTGTSSSKLSRVPPRPFSVHDNLALDQAWLKLQDADQTPADTLGSRQARSRRQSIKREDDSSELYAASIPPKGSTDKGKSPQEKTTLDERINMDGNLETQETTDDKNSAAGRNGNAPASQIAHGLGPQHPEAHTSVSGDAVHHSLQDVAPVSAMEIVQDEINQTLPRARRKRSFFHRKEEEKSTEDISSSRISSRRLSRGRQEADDGANALGRSPDTTGTPFLRVPSRLRRSPSRSRSPNNEVQKAQHDGPGSPERDYRPKQSSPLGAAPRFPRFSSNREAQDEDDSDSDSSSEGHHFFSRRLSMSRGAGNAHITVGISRLHFVEMPSLKVCQYASRRHGKGAWRCLADMT